MPETLNPCLLSPNAAAARRVFPYHLCFVPGSESKFGARISTALLYGQTLTARLLPPILSISDTPIHTVGGLRLCLRNLSQTLSMAAVMVLASLCGKDA